MVPKQVPFFISRDNLGIIRAAMDRRKAHPINILITGKHGLGKSELARQIAANWQLDYTPVPISLLQESGQLMGHNEFSEGKTQFVKSEFVRAVGTPNSLIHLEELNRPESPKALGELFPMLDDSRMIVHEKLGEVHVAPGVVFIGTLNEGFEYSGIDPLDEALRDRFFFLELSYLPPQVETNLIVTRTGMTGEVVNGLIKFANSLRANAKEPIHISTRRVLMMAELIGSGLDFKGAVKSCVGIGKDKLESVLLSLDLQGKLDSKGTDGEGKYELLRQ